MRNPKIALVLKLDSYSENTSVGLFAILSQSRCTYLSIQKANARNVRKRKRTIFRFQNAK